MEKVKLYILTFFISIFAAAGICTVATPINVYADQDACDVTGYDDPLLCGTKRSDEERELMARIRAILDTVYLWIGIIAVIVIVIGGVRYMTSQGTPDKIKGAKNTILYALIGLLVTLMAFAITNFFISALEGKSVVSGDAPTAAREDPDHNKVRGIVVVSNVDLVTGQTAKLKPKIVPDYATDQTIEYKSNDPTIASVDKNGNIKTYKDGETTIIVSSPDGVSKEVKVVVRKPVPVDSIQLSANKIEVKKGKTVTVTATIKPNNAADKTIGWESANPKVATVNQQGRIKGIKEGDTTVTVYARNRLTVAQAQVQPSKIVLAAEDISDIKNSPTVVKNSIKVTVPSDSYAVSSIPTTQMNYSRKGLFTKKTEEIIKKHMNDFSCKNYSSFMKSQGGYTKYVKSLGGIFAVLAGKSTKIQIKTAADFQAVAEYVYGLWTIWGPDYNNYFSHKQDNPHYVNWPSSKGPFYGPCPEKRGIKSSNFKAFAPAKKIDTVLQNPNKIRTHCNGSVDVFRKSTSLKWVAGAANPGQLLKHGKKITKMTDLQVGDIMAFYRGGKWRHTSIVGEVYKDYVVTYDGGGTIKKGNFKKYVKRVNGKFANYSEWYAIRVNNIDQTKTLEGLK